ncbi:acyl-CoA carboxylase subunit epsilon [Streptomyces canarius]
MNIKVVRGNPTPEELAAALAVVRRPRRGGSDDAVRRGAPEGRVVRPDRGIAAHRVPRPGPRPGPAPTGRAGCSKIYTRAPT